MHGSDDIFDPHSDLLTKGLFDFKDPRGRQFAERMQPFQTWVDASSEAGYFQFLRHHADAPDRHTEVIGWGGQRYTGINFASQDYLGLSRHPAVKQAAISAVVAQGTHSAGSEPMGGGMDAGKALERELSALLGHPHVVLFPTGWAAGYGAIQALVRPYDHVVLDALAHNCLQHGASASTANIAHFSHNDMGSLRKRLERIRRNAPDVAILVITESLFSMDSDHPPFDKLVEACQESGASLMIDAAHDLGVLGSKGRGLLWDSGVSGEVDFIMGSFSKTFASIGGFFAAKEKASTYYVRGYSGSYTFSNYLIPPQLAAIRAALSIVCSSEGEALREATIDRASRLRSALDQEGLPALGILSSLVLPQIGAESVARIAYRRCLENGLILNNIEFPACRRGAARFRLQVTPYHTDEEIDVAARVLGEAVRFANRKVANGK